MGVLQIKNRVLITFRFGQRQIKIQVTFHAPHNKEIAHNIFPNLLDQFAERDIVGLAGRHFYLFAAARQSHELMDQNLNRVSVISQSL
ncbi:MAG: hypothetical protein V1715_14080 [bacterium]